MSQINIYRFLYRNIIKNDSVFVKNLKFNFPVTFFKTVFINEDNSYRTFLFYFSHLSAKSNKIDLKTLL